MSPDASLPQAGADRAAGGRSGAAPQTAAGAAPRGYGSATPRGTRRPAGALPGPRQEYLDAFDDDAFDDDVFEAGAPEAAGPRRRRPGVEPAEHPADGPDEEAAVPDAQGHRVRREKSGRGRAFTGVAAAAVTTVLAVVVTGQMVDDGSPRGVSRAAGDVAREDPGDASRSDDRPLPAEPARQLSYREALDARFPLAADYAGSGRFRTISGRDEAPGKGQVVRYRVDVEQDLPLDGELFAQAVHRTLNDGRSWSHGGIRTFERVSGGDADWVITLAGPRTTAAWCAKSGLDTTVDNVSCDAAATERVMINAYRWAQGAETYGDLMADYRQMLVNHEVGHRLGRNHEGCTEEGALAPVMMQQTKFLSTEGVACRPNPWPFPED